MVCEIFRFRPPLKKKYIFLIVERKADETQQHVGPTQAEPRRMEKGPTVSILLKNLKLLISYIYTYVPK